MVVKLKVNFNFLSESKHHVSALYVLLVVMQTTIEAASCGLNPRCVSAFSAITLSELRKFAIANGEPLNFNDNE